MTSRESTVLLTLRDDTAPGLATRPLRDQLAVWTWGVITWPFLAYSLWGGTKASKRRLLARLGLADNALPNLGSWKADTGLLHKIVDAVEELRPRVVVELGAGATTLICARALERNGGGTLYSYDQHAAFIDQTRAWVEGEGATAIMRHAPLGPPPEGWPGLWYQLSDVPEVIDLIIIDGPPWTLHPQVRGAAEVLFARLSPGGMVLLDDAARPGERMVARRWAKSWPGMTFRRLGGGTKGTLLGRKSLA